MRRSAYRVAWLASAGLALALAGGRRSAADGAALHVDVDRGDARIGGRVVDEAGSPVAGARVDAFAWFDLTRASGALFHTFTSPLPPARFSSKSGADGRFALRGLPQGSYAVRVESSDGRLANPVTFATASAASPPLLVTVGRGTEVAGRVRDAAGHPLAGTEVLVERRDLLPYAGTLVMNVLGRVRTRSDAEGRFRVVSPWVDEGLAVVVVTEGVTRWTFLPVASPADLEVTVGAGPRDAVRGFVRGARTRRPVASATVTIGVSSPDAQEDALREIVRVRTRADGSFETDLPRARGAIATYVEAEGIGADGSSSEGSGPLALEVRRGAVVTGRVAGEDGTPLVGARVHVWPLHSPALSVRTDADGRYRIEAVPRSFTGGKPHGPEDTVLLAWVDAPGFGVAWSVFDVPLGRAQATHDFVARRGAVVRGRVEGRGARFVAWGDEEVDPWGEMLFPTAVVCSDDGSFELVDLPPGRRSLHAGGDPTVVTLASGQVLEGVVLRTAKHEGTGR